MKLILTFKANATFTDLLRNTSPHTVATFNHFDEDDVNTTDVGVVTAALLLNYDARVVVVKNHEGITPMQCTAKYGSERMVHIQKSYGTDMQIY